MTRLLLVALALALPACALDAQSLSTLDTATLACGQVEKLRYTIPNKAECWVLRKPTGDCVATARNVDACDVPEQSDELFAAGDVATVWCDVLSTGDPEFVFKPVDCATGESIAL